MPQITLGNLSTYYCSDGEGSLVFLLFNGAGCTTETWGELADGLSLLGQVVRFDARGCGKTELPRVEYTLETLAADALALIDHLEIPKVILVGHAFGGRVAQIFSRDHVDRTSALILCGTGGFYPPHIDDLPPDLPREDAFLARFCGPKFCDEQPEVARRLLDEVFAQRPPREAGEYRVQAITATPAKTYWGMTPDSVPVLLLYGTEDRYGHTDNAHDLTSRLKNSRLVFIEGAGHFAVREKPKKVLAEITTFIKEHRL